MKLMLVEDDPTDLQTFQDSFDLYPNCSEISLEILQKLEEIPSKLVNSFDGIILDLSIEGNPDGDREFLRQVIANKLRIPVIIFTGTPDAAPTEYPIIGSYKKGAKLISEVLDELRTVYNSGITKVLGGRGSIETLLDNFFVNVVLPNLGTWVNRGAIDPDKSEKSLLRFAANHIVHDIDFDSEVVFPEEFYIYTSTSMDKVTTGSVLANIFDSSMYLILNPACDLVVRQVGLRKASHFIAAKISPFSQEISSITSSSKTREKKERLLSELSRNCDGTPQHYLPHSDLFQGGFVHFKDLRLIDINRCAEEFSIAPVQISSHFIRDILFRFSSHMGRQGQPEIEVSHLIPQ